MASGPNWVEYLTLGVATVGAIAPLLMWRHKIAEKFDLAPTFFYGQDTDGSECAWSAVVIHNRSTDTIFLSEIHVHWGAIFRKKFRYTALPSEDPEDVNFPYSIDADGHRTFRVEFFRPIENLKVLKFAQAFSFFGRPSVWIGVQTIRGTKRFVNAEPMLRHHEMPDWMKKQHDVI